MCHNATRRLVAVLVCGLALTPVLGAQLAGTAPQWRRLGGYTIDLALAGPASGPVERVWYSPDGSRLLARTRSGDVFETSDFEKWQLVRATPPPAEDPGAPRSTPADPLRRYRSGPQVHRSDDGGATWGDQTALDGQSILGAPVSDLAVSPKDPDEVVVANDLGIWRSLDGGLTWSGLNEGLPNLPGRRLLALPQGGRGLRVLADGLGALEWAPGEKQSWRLVADPASGQELAARRLLSAVLEAPITALAFAGEAAYAGAADGRLWTSPDRGASWRLSRPADGAPVEGMFADPANPRLALAALGGADGARVLRTTNGGLFWDDVSADLPPGAAHAVAADLPSGTVYVATDRGVFFTRTELSVAGPVSGWSRLEGAFPPARVLDLRLDGDGNQLFVLLEGRGVWAGLAPHRLGSFRVVNAADFSQRPAAPGSLVSVLGGRVRAARSGDLEFPVLAASESESQIQVPFEARERLISLALDGGARRVTVGLALRQVSPAIFVDRDGTPLVINAESGALLDAMNPAYSNSHVQILATGLGQVRPPWPSGLAAPAENPPRVAAQVRAFLDGEPLEVTRAVLAPGYVGLYLVEVRLPAIVNRGPAVLHLQAEGQDSNRVRLYLEP